jgi:hypothetical protein
VSAAQRLLRRQGVTLCAAATLDQATAAADYLESSLERL